MNGSRGDVGDLFVATVVVNVQDMERGVRFWTSALGYERRESTWDPEFQMLVDPHGRHLPVSLQLAHSGPVEPVRIHLDLYTDDQAAQVERLVELGAVEAENWPYPENADFVILRDPDGNEFCVVNHAQL